MTILLISHLKGTCYQYRIKDKRHNVVFLYVNNNHIIKIHLCPGTKRTILAGRANQEEVVSIERGKR